MAVTTAVPTPIAETTAPRRLTVEEFERIPDGVFPEGERLELIDGLIYTKMGQNDPHIFALLYSTRALQEVFGKGFTIMIQAPTRFDGGSKVEPDLLILRGQIENYEERRVNPPNDVALIVEISDTSLPYDQCPKCALYANHGVSEYWIVNLRDRTLEIRRRPFPESSLYAETIIAQEGERVAVGNGEVAVGDLLPKAP